MRALICDNCPNSVPLDDGVLSRASDWIQVGWHGGHMHDACSPQCARAIIDSMVDAT